MSEAKIHIDMSEVKAAALRAAGLTVETIRGEIVTAQVMPFDLGDLQNNQQWTDEHGGTIATEAEDFGDSIIASIESGGPQARRLYYHPEYDFQTVNNPDAGGLWFDKYQAMYPGYIKRVFKKLLKEELGQ